MKIYPYLVYLRHHGFPSPLLDWSHSPYIAAFFAFRESFPTVEERAIYAFCETPDGSKGGWAEDPKIHRVGPYVRTHQRHFRQQSDYTICIANEKGTTAFHAHDNVFDRDAPDQDLLWKMTLPSAERIRVLRALDKFNLNGSSLFNSDETLMETMWSREWLFKKH